MEQGAESYASSKEFKLPSVFLKHLVRQEPGANDTSRPSILTAYNLFDAIVEWRNTLSVGYEGRTEHFLLALAEIALELTEKNVSPMIRRWVMNTASGTCLRERYVPRKEYPNSSTMVFVRVINAISCDDPTETFMKFVSGENES